MGPFQPNSAWRLPKQPISYWLISMDTINMTYRKLKELVTKCLFATVNYWKDQDSPIYLPGTLDKCSETARPWCWKLLSSRQYGSCIAAPTFSLLRKPLARKEIGTTATPGSAMLLSPFTPCCGWVMGKEAGQFYKLGRETLPGYKRKYRHELCIA